MKTKSLLAIGALAVMASAFAGALPAAAAAADSSAPSGTQNSQPSWNRKAARAANHALARRIYKQLVSTKGLQNSDIAVFAMADTGEVILSGVISDASQDQLASDTAKKVQGVTSVSSKLTIREEGS